MKRLPGLLAGLLIVAEAAAGEHRQLFDALRRVESGNNPEAVGDGGRARGPYQIRRIYWEDACRYGKLDWSYEENVEDPRRCEKVMRLYWKKYGARTDEQRARLHNGGPTGLRKNATLRYWAKVQRELAAPPALSSARPVPRRGR